MPLIPALSIGKQISVSCRPAWGCVSEILLQNKKLPERTKKEEKKKVKGEKESHALQKRSG